MTTYDDTDETYTGYEDPEQVYEVLADLPVLYTGAWQIRQFGAGDASTYGAGASILSALANPSANMVTAAENAESYLGGLDGEHGNGETGYNYPVTANDKNRYFPA